MEEQPNTPPNYYEQMISGLQQENSDQQRQMGEMAQNMSNFANNPQENLVRWQLDISEDLDRIYHLLKGDIIEIDSEGNIIYKEQPNPDLRPFNHHGVQLIMNIMSFYLNRNTLLSNYDEVTINWKVLDFSKRIRDFVLDKYKEMGMDTIEKQTMYPMIVTELVDTVHSAYLRALNGGERGSLRTARSVIQTENPASLNLFNGQQAQEKRTKWYNPTTWMK